MEETTMEPTEGPGHTSMEGAAENAVDPRIERIIDYVNQALQASDPLQANLGVINGDMMQIAYMLKAMLNDCLQQPPETINGVAVVMPAVDNYLRVCKQIASVSQLVEKLQGTSGAF